jgi:uncharacterized membrane protein
VTGRIAVLLAATLATGLMAGLFWAFAVAVMPGLARTGDRAFVEAMQRINVAILNPLFLSLFTGAPLLTAVAAVLHLGRPALPWIAAGLVLYVIGLVITGVVNVPLNNALLGAGDADPGAARAGFEAAWVRWNLVRTAALTLSLASLAWALVVSG